MKERGEERRTIMTNDIVDGRWKQNKGKIRKGWGIFTQDHQNKTTGQRNQFLGELQEQYGHTKDILGKRLRELK
jgi:uncharacterized protein YjbJ (UPF0337 family)